MFTAGLLTLWRVFANNDNRAFAALSGLLDLARRDELLLRLRGPFGGTGSPVAADVDE